MYQVRGTNKRSLSFAAAPAFMLGQTITNQDVVTELTARGYNRGTAPITPTLTPTVTPPATVPAITREQAITAGVDNALKMYGYSTRCTQPGGCWLSTYRYDSIVTRATYNANRYLTYQRISGLSGMTIQPMGQAQYTQPLGPPAPEPTGMTRSEKAAFAMDIVSNLLQTGATYLRTRAERERLQKLQTTIPQLTAVELDRIIRAYQAAAAGGTGEQVKAVESEAETLTKAAMPGWLMPVVVGLAALVVIPMIGKR